GGAPGHAGALGNHERQEAKDERKARHHHRPEPKFSAFDRRIADAFALLALLYGKFYYHNTVLRSERDQYHRSVLRRDVEAEPSQQHPGNRSEHADRHGQ